MFPYVEERFTADEEAILRRYFTNLDRPVFALVNLPEVVKGALFARYSRSPKSLRRLFLDEFVGDLDISGDASIDATVGLTRAEELYERVFFEYGDDSVAQLGGVHLACEQASNILTKILEWGRLMAYLEQSTRYIAYDARLPNGHYRYHRPTRRSSSPPSGPATWATWTGCSTPTASCCPGCRAGSARFPRQPGDSDFVHRQAVRAKALDALRGLLPAGLALQRRHLRHRPVLRAAAAADAVHPLPEARLYAELMLTELRKVIPSFLQRVDLAERGGEWSGLPRRHPRRDRRGSSSGCGPTRRRAPTEAGRPARSPWSTSTPKARTRCWRRSASPHVRLLRGRGAAPGPRLPADERVALLAAYVGDRKQPPAPARPGLRADGLPLRDRLGLRRVPRPAAPPHADHRVAAARPPRSATTSPTLVAEAGRSAATSSPLERSRDLHDALAAAFPAQAAYAVALAFRIRYVMQMNAREAMHLIELRSGPQGHPAYRRVAQEMHRAIDRGRRPPRHRRGDALRRLRSDRPRAAGGGAAGRGPARRARKRPGKSASS